VGALRPLRGGSEVVVAEVLQPPLDTSGFARRECPACGAHFKVRWNRREERAVATSLTGRVEHLNPSEAAATAPERHCPYCGVRDGAEAWWTEGQLRWLDGEARALERELRWLRMRLPIERLGDNPRPTYVPLSPRRRHRGPSVLDDPDDLVPVPLPCCGEELKVSAAWPGPIRCPWCGFVHARAWRRDVARELATLRSWAAARRGPR
jgi:hypothetical protein